MWPFKQTAAVVPFGVNDEPAWKKAVEETEANRAALSERVGVSKAPPLYLYNKDAFSQLGRSTDELYAMIDALEKRVRELESRG